MGSTPSTIAWTTTRHFATTLKPINSSLMREATQENAPSQTYVCVLDQVEAAMHNMYFVETAMSKPNYATVCLVHACTCFCVRVYACLLIFELLDSSALYFAK